MDNAIITLARTERDIHGIKKLQQQNIKRERDPQEMLREGFVTIEYSIEELHALSGEGNHVVIKQSDTVCGYALYVPRKSFVVREDLGHLSQIAVRNYGEGHTWCIMGQVCVGSILRGKGYFRKMYHFMRDAYRDNHGGILTDISSKNPRSLSAHMSVGFHVLDTYLDEVGVEWHIVAWPWSKP